MDAHTLRAELIDAREAHKRAIAELTAKHAAAVRESAMRREACMLLVHGMGSLHLKYGKSDGVVAENIARLKEAGCRQELAEFIAGVKKDVYVMRHDTVIHDS